MKAFAGLSDGLAGYKIDRLQHSLQTATRAEDEGANIDQIVAALVHDIDDELAPLSHSEFAAALLKPFVSEDIVWVIEKHGLFQAYYYAHHVGGGDRHARNKYKDHPFYDRCVQFCEAWDHTSLDPSYPSRSLDYFEPMVREVFARRAQ